MNHIFLPRLVIVCFLSFCHTNALCALIKLDWLNDGDNLIVRDTNTGLEWLNLEVTGRMNKNTVLDLIQNDPKFNEFRYATFSEWSILATSIGLDSNYFGDEPYPENYIPTLYLHDLLGVTYPTNGDNNISVGMLADQYGLCCARTIYTNVWHAASNPNLGDTARVRTIATTLVYGTGSEIASVGSYLVRVSQVPIPPTLWLFGSGLLGLIGISRRKKA